MHERYKKNWLVHVIVNFDFIIISRKQGLKSTTIKNSIHLTCLLLFSIVIVNNRSVIVTSYETKLSTKTRPLFKKSSIFIYTISPHSQSETKCRYTQPGGGEFLLPPLLKILSDSLVYISHLSFLHALSPTSQPCWGNSPTFARRRYRPPTPVFIMTPLQFSEKDIVTFT